LMNAAISLSYTTTLSLSPSNHLTLSYTPFSFMNAAIAQLTAISLPPIAQLSHLGMLIQGWAIYRQIE